MNVMISKISKQSVIVIVPVAAASLLFTQWRFSFSLALGGAISLGSFRVIAWGVKKFLGKQMAQPVIMGLSVLKLLLISAFLMCLAYLKLIHPVGFVIGFTLVLVIIAREGFLYARRES